MFRLGVILIFIRVPEKRSNESRKGPPKTVYRSFAVGSKTMSTKSASNKTLSRPLYQLESQVRYKKSAKRNGRGNLLYQDKDNRLSKWEELVGALQLDSTLPGWTSVKGIGRWFFWEMKIYSSVLFTYSQVLDWTMFWLQGTLSRSKHGWDHTRISYAKDCNCVQLFFNAVEYDQILYIYVQGIPGAKHSHKIDDIYIDCLFQNLSHAFGISMA